MADDIFDKERAEAASYEDEITSRRTVTIPLREYDELKKQQNFIKDPSLISGEESMVIVLTIVSSPSASCRSLCSFLYFSSHVSVIF